MSYPYRLYNKLYRPLHNARRDYVNIETGQVISRRYFRSLEKTEKVPPASLPITYSKKPIKTETPTVSQNTPKPSRTKTKSIPINTIPERMSVKDIQHIRAKSRYQKVLDSRIDRINKQFGPAISKNTLRTSDTFKAQYKAYKNGKDREKGGKRHQALIDFGILDEDDDYY